MVNVNIYKETPSLGVYCCCQETGYKTKSKIICSKMKKLSLDHLNLVLNCFQKEEEHLIRFIQTRIDQNTSSPFPFLCVNIHIESSVSSLWVVFSEMEPHVSQIWAGST